MNGTIDTNLGLFRAYMSMYLRHHPFVSKELLLMVRTLPPVANGLPVQIYCFSSNKNWPSYESIQAEIMEHFVSVLPAFELYPFQNADARDMILSSYIESAKVDLSTLIGIPWHTTVTQSNPFDVENRRCKTHIRSISRSEFHPLSTRRSVPNIGKANIGNRHRFAEVQQPARTRPRRIRTIQKHPLPIPAGGIRYSQSNVR